MHLAEHIELQYPCILASSLFCNSASTILELVVDIDCRRMDDENELRFGVVDDVLYGVKRTPVPGAQWTGVVTGIAVQMLESGAVDAVVCVQSDPNDRCACKKCSKPQQLTCALTVTGTAVQMLDSGAVDAGRSAVFVTAFNSVFGSATATAPLQQQQRQRRGNTTEDALQPLFQQQQQQHYLQVYHHNCCTGISLADVFLPTTTSSCTRFKQ
jgi:hypothetical protein